jgi:excisionase family DNA binding protein
MISIKEVRKRLESRVALPLWPDVGGDILGLSRGKTYDAAARGHIKTFRLGRMYRVPSVWLKAWLGLDDAEPSQPDRRRRGR